MKSSKPTGAVDRRSLKFGLPSKSLIYNTKTGIFYAA